MHWTMRSRSPSAALAWARILSAQSTGHCKLPVLQRQLASYKELAAQMQERDVIGDGEGNLGQGEVQGLEPCFDLSGHDVSNWLCRFAGRGTSAKIGPVASRGEPLSRRAVGAKNPRPRAIGGEAPAQE